MLQIFVVGVIKLSVARANKEKIKLLITEILFCGF